MPLVVIAPQCPSQGPGVQRIAHRGGLLQDGAALGWIAHRGGLLQRERRSL